MAKIDRILRLQIHHSYELRKISMLNKQMLIAQYAQCEQISALQKQIRQSNSISRQILENQLKEFQYREKIKYYKSLAYNMNEATSFISNETNSTLQTFLCNLFLETITINIKESKDNLEDISDKSFCKEVENKISNIREQINQNRIEYQESEFPNLINWEGYYEKKKADLNNQKIESIVQLAKIRDEQKIELTPKPYKNKTRGCLITFLSILLLPTILLMVVAVFTDLTVFVSFFIVIFLPISIPLFINIQEDRKWKKNYPTYLSSIETSKNNDEKKYEAYENKVKEELESHPYIKTKEIVSLQYPDWEEKVESVYSFLPKEEETDEKGQKQRDPIFLEVAKFVITNQTMSPYLIQQKFSIGYNRASKIVDELAELKIIDLRNKKILLDDANYLEMLIKKYE